MNKLNFIFPVVAIMLASSCVKEQPVNAGGNDNLVPMTFKASTESETKTSLDGKTVNWSVGDKISVFAINEGAVVSHTGFAASNIDGVKADFEGATDAEASDFVALYPYNANASVSIVEGVTTVKTTIPYIQKAVKGGFDTNLNLMLATTDKETAYLSFKNLCSLLKITVPAAEEGDDLTKITSISLNLREPGVGSFSYDPATGAALKSGDNGGKTVSLVSEDGTPLEAGDYYFVISSHLAANYGGSKQAVLWLGAGLTNGDIRTIQNADNKLELSANKIYNLGTLSFAKAKPDLTILNAPVGDFPMGVKDYQLQWAFNDGNEDNSQVTFSARNSNVSVDANGLVTFKGIPEPAHVHVNYKGYVYPVAFNLTKGYYRETYNSASLTDNAWYSKNPWANSKHKSQDPEMTASALKVYPQATVKATDEGTYKQYRCDMIKTCSSSSPVYLNIDYPIVCFHIDDVADLKAVNRNITFDVVEKDGGIGGSVQANNNDGKYKYTVNNKKVLIYDLTQQKIGSNWLSDYGIIEFGKTFQLKYADINSATKSADLDLSSGINFYGFYTFRNLSEAKAYFGITE